MGGAEVAALLIEQVVVEEGVTQAELWLGPYKTNTKAERTVRTLRCSCRAGPGGAWSEIGAGACPVHAAHRILQRRASEGWTSKHPLFPGTRGQATTPAEARAKIRRACGEQALSEHSLRRMGAQFYARRGLQLSVIQYIGRWGSAAVERYVADALAGRAAWAPLAAASELDLSDVVAHGGAKAGPGLGALKR